MYLLLCTPFTEAMKEKMKIGMKSELRGGIKGFVQPCKHLHIVEGWLKHCHVHVVEWVCILLWSIMLCNLTPDTLVNPIDDSGRKNGVQKLADKKNNDGMQEEISSVPHGMKINH